MKRFFGILMIGLVAVGSQANPINDPTNEARVEISTAVENNRLDILVDDQLAGTKVTVSVFSSMGEIVLESTLGLGLNKLDVEQLEQGKYTAVVRENGEYASKQTFVVS
jgi:hypothetical protein